MKLRGKKLFVIGVVAAAVVAGSGLFWMGRRASTAVEDVASEIDRIERASKEEQARCFARMRNIEPVQREISERLREMLDHFKAAEVRRLRDAWVESRRAEDVGVRLLDAHFAYYEGRMEEALALQRREIERMPRGDWRRSELRAWSKISFELRSIPDTYDAWPDKQELLRAIWSPKKESSLVNVEQLANLLATHRTKAPDDPLLPTYEQAVANHGLQPSTANFVVSPDQAIPRVATLTTSELREQIEDGSLLRENFYEILYRLEQLEDPDLFERLWCQLHTEDHAHHSWRYSEYWLDLLWCEREWAAIVDMCDGGSPEFVERYDLQDHVRSRLAIALLHQGSVDVCRRVLANQRNSEEEQMLLSVVAKEPQRALEQARSISGPAPLHPFNCYAISHGLPGVDEFLASDGWRKLCSEKPVKLLPSLIQSPEYDLLLFQRQVQPASVEWLQDRLSKACIAFEEVREMPDAVATQRSFRVTTSRDLYWVTIGSAPLRQRRSLEPYLREPLPPSLRPLAEHRAWIAVQQQESYRKRTTAGPIAAALADDDTLGVVVQAQFTNWWHLPSSPEFWEERRQGKKFIRFDRFDDWRGPPTRVDEAPRIRDTALLGEEYFPWREHCRKVADGAAGGRITVLIYHGCAAESLTFDVESATHVAFGHYNVRARLTHDSQYQPCLVQGALADIPSRFIHAWTLPQSSGPQSVEP